LRTYERNQLLHTQQRVATDGGGMAVFTRVVIVC
jgi:hypothetical protein